MELESFVRAVAENRQSNVTGQDGLKALKVCEAALESAKIKRGVALTY